MFRNRQWLWYFGAVTILSLLSVILLLRYVGKLAPVATRESLDAARAKWEEHGPKNYLLTYQILATEERRPETYKVQVIDGRVAEADYSDEEFSPDMTWTPISLPNENAFSVPALFDLIERGLQANQESEEPRYSATALYREEMGYPSRYVRRTLGGDERLEIRIVKLEPIEE